MQGYTGKYMKNLKLVSVVILLMLSGQSMAFTIEGSEEPVDSGSTSGGSESTENNTSAGSSNTNTEERPWEANYQKPQIKIKDPRQYSRTAH